MEPSACEWDYSCRAWARGMRGFSIHAQASLQGLGPGHAGFSICGAPHAGPGLRARRLRAAGRRRPPPVGLGPLRSGRCGAGPAAGLGLGTQASQLRCAGPRCRAWGPQEGFSICVCGPPARGTGPRVPRPQRQAGPAAAGPGSAGSVAMGSQGWACGT